MNTLFEFLDSALTPYHAEKVARDFFEEEGFIALSPNAQWHLQAGERYFVDYKDGSILCFVMPLEKPIGARIISAHTDSPALRIKPEPTMIREGLTMLNIEVYGGPISETWFDRTLAVAGLVYTKGTSWAHPVRHVVTLKNTVTIPSLAIHMKRDGAEVNPQKELIALWSAQDGTSFTKALARACECAPEDILSHELYLVSAEKAAHVGYEGSLYQSSRIDNLANTYAGLASLPMSVSAPKNHIALFLSYQNEEIGSRSAGGAASPRLKALLARLGVAEGDNLILSADQAHAAHPNYPEKADPVLRPRLGKGPVLKLAANHSYATTARGEAMLRGLACAHNIPLQTFCNRADMRGGSTIGPIAEACTAIPAIDIGAPMLAMHSIRELADLSDQLYMQNLMKAFWMDEAL